MVSIEERGSYLKKIQQIPKINLFFDLLNGKHCANDITSVDASYVGFINSLLDDNEQYFKKLYKDFSRKKPFSDSLWINDDFLVFVLILGIVHYKIDTTWIKEAIKARTTQKPEQSQINTTLSNILEKNLSNNGNLYEIILVFQKSLNISLSVEHFNDLYIKISNDLNLFSSNNDFLVCLSIKSIDIIITNRSEEHTSELQSPD